MSRNAADSLFRLYASAYVPMTLSRDGFDPWQKADLERQIAAASSPEAMRSRFSPIAAGALAVLALVILGSTGAFGV